MDEGPINVLLADDDEGFLASLRELVDRQPELHVVAVARNGIEAIEYADEHDPDAAVVERAAVSQHSTSRSPTPRDEADDPPLVKGVKELLDAKKDR